MRTLIKQISNGVGIFVLASLYPFTVRAKPVVDLYDWFQSPASYVFEILLGLGFLVTAICVFLKLRGGAHLPSIAQLERWLAHNDNHPKQKLGGRASVIWSARGKKSDSHDIGLAIKYAQRECTDGLYCLFQPQYDCGERELYRAETLVRWHHPELGEISPATFIPVLEKANLLGFITRFVLNEAIALAGQYARAGRYFVVSVNLSVRDLAGHELVVLIPRLLHEHSCPPGRIIIELTETAFVKDPDLVGTALRELRRMGVRVSIDDFGTGFASLTYLSNFPADEVKIDRYFVSRMLESPKDRAIVKSTIMLAHELDLDVVGEGVETEQMLHELKMLGCDYAQGFYLSRPVIGSDLFSQSGPAQLVEAGMA